MWFYRQNGLLNSLFNWIYMHIGPLINELKIGVFAHWTLVNAKIALFTFSILQIKILKNVNM